MINILRDYKMKGYNIPQANKKFVKLNIKRNLKRGFTR